MFWIIYSILSASLWAFSNYIDKYLIERFCKGLNVGSLVLFSSAIGIPVSAFIFAFYPNVFDINLFEIFILTFSGNFFLLGVVLYLYALSKDEASIVAPQLLMIPVFSALFSYIFLGEQLSFIQIIGIIVVILGSMLLSTNINDIKKPKFKSPIFILMVFSSSFMAINAVIFKYGIVSDATFWTVAFWEHVGFIIFGLVCFVFIRSYRNEFIYLVKTNGVGVLSLNVLNEILTIIGNLSFHYATIFAPIAIVETVTEGIQPVFVIIYGLLLTIFFSKIINERIDKKTLFQKIFAILIMYVGLQTLIFTF